MKERGRDGEGDIGQRVETEVIRPIGRGGEKELGWRRRSAETDPAKILDGKRILWLEPREDSHHDDGQDLDKEEVIHDE